MAEPVTHIGIYYKQTRPAPVLANREWLHDSAPIAIGVPVHFKDFEFHVGGPDFKTEKEGFILLRTIEIPPTYLQQFRTQFKTQDKMGHITYNVADHTSDRRNPRKVALSLQFYPKGDPKEAEQFIKDTPALGSFLELSVIPHLREDRVTHAVGSAYQLGARRHQMESIGAKGEEPLDSLEAKLRERVIRKVGESVLAYLV